MWEDGEGEEDIISRGARKRGLEEREGGRSWTVRGIRVRGTMTEKKRKRGKEKGTDMRRKKEGKSKREGERRKGRARERKVNGEEGLRMRDGYKGRRGEGRERERESERRPLLVLFIISSSLSDRND
jgi:hypothetical protein